ncbi:MAG: LysM peptidoglycan-binding domain-containing protein [Myxococcales bacterium]|nr:LysM peptidoglycan-binding domain-containing protein [Myxococcales bacterium]
MKDYSISVLSGLLSLLRMVGIATNAGPSKLSIQYETFRAGSYDGKIKALFNPNSITTTSTVSWTPVHYEYNKSAAYALKFANKSVAPPTLSLDLFFDTYEGDQGGSLISMPNPTALHPLSLPSGKTVLSHTTSVANLMQINRELHRPPHCQVWWGMIKLIEGPLTGLTQSFTRFIDDGTPVRAKLTCTFTDASFDGSELRSSDVEKTHTVRLGESLDAIAARHYEDATKWRVIAEANDIDDPRALRPGTVLRIPAIR